MSRWLVKENFAIYNPANPDHISKYSQQIFIRIRYLKFNKNVMLADYAQQG